jgi:hypothetical protein
MERRREKAAKDREKEQRIDSSWLSEVCNFAY